MVKFEEITSFVSSVIGKYFGSETKWPDIVEDVRKKGIKFAEAVQSTYDSSMNVILKQGEKSDTKAQNPDIHKGLRTEAKQPKSPANKAAAPEKKPAASLKKAKAAHGDTVPTVRNPRAKKGLDLESAGTAAKPAEPKPAKTHAAKPRGRTKKI